MATDKRVGGVERWLRFILAYNGGRLSTGPAAAAASVTRSPAELALRHCQGVSIPGLDWYQSEWSDGSADRRAGLVDVSWSL